MEQPQYSYYAINIKQQFVVWKRGYVVAAVLSRAQLCNLFYHQDTIISIPAFQAGRRQLGIDVDVLLQQHWNIQGWGY